MGPDVFRRLALPRKLIPNGAVALNAILATPVERWVDSSLAAAFAAKATVYDKAMDAVYNATHVGGSMHRLFDGSHSLPGAWAQVTHATGGDLFTQEVGGYLAALWKDLVTVRGLPVATWDHETFRHFAQSLSHVLPASPDWFFDFLNVNAAELLGASAGVIAVLLNWDEGDVAQFSGLAGSFGISACVAANPLLGFLAACCLARAYERAKRNGSSGEIARHAIRGGTRTGAFLAGAVLLVGPVWIPLALAIVLAILAKKKDQEAGVGASGIDWPGVARQTAVLLGQIGKELAGRAGSSASRPAKVPRSMSRMRRLNPR